MDENKGSAVSMLHDKDWSASSARLILRHRLAHRRIAHRSMRNKQSVVGTGVAGGATVVGTLHLILAGAPTVIGTSSDPYRRTHGIWDFI